MGVFSIANIDVYFGMASELLSRLDLPLKTILLALGIPGLTTPISRQTLLLVCKRLVSETDVVSLDPFSESSIKGTCDD